LHDVRLPDYLLSRLDLANKFSKWSNDQLAMILLLLGASSVLDISFSARPETGRAFHDYALIMCENTLLANKKTHLLQTWDKL